MSARHAELLRRVLIRRGTAITLKSAGLTGNTSTLGVSGSAASESGKCTPPAPFRSDLIDGESVVLEDLEVKVLASDWSTVTPAAGIQATIGSDTFTVIGARPMYEGSDVYGYWLHLRGTS